MPIGAMPTKLSLRKFEARIELLMLPAVAFNAALLRHVFAPHFFTVTFT